MPTWQRKFVTIIYVTDYHNFICKIMNNLYNPEERIVTFFQWDVLLHFLPLLEGIKVFLIKKKPSYNLNTEVGCATLSSLQALVDTLQKNGSRALLCALKSD